MPRKRKAATQTMIAAAARLASLKSVDPALDLGAGLKIADFDNVIKATNGKLEQYNTSLGVSDGFLNEFNQQEKILKDINERMLAAVGARFGKDSDEYEKAGGVRKSERKKPTKKNPPA